MIKNKISKLLVIITVISLVFSITGCSRSKTNNAKIEKLAVTKENVQKVFANKYDVEVYSISSNGKSISSVFHTKTDIQKNKAKETLIEVKNTLHKNFNITDDNSITIENEGHILIKDDSGKIQTGEIPEINKSNYMYDTVYSMSKKFNLLNPFEGVKLTADDNEDGDITSRIKLKNPEVITKLGEHNLIYEVIDSDGNTANIDLKINVKQ